MNFRRCGFKIFILLQPAYSDYPLIQSFGTGLFGLAGSILFFSIYQRSEGNYKPEHIIPADPTIVANLYPSLKSIRESGVGIVEWGGIDLW